MTRTKSSRALVSVVLAVLMAVAFMPAISYTSFAATAKKAKKVVKVYHTGNKTYTRTVGSAWTLKYKLSPSKLTTAAKKVVWKSSNKSVVNVSAKSGNKAAVSFKKVGTATVTVYTKANKKAKATWKFKVVPKSEAKKVAATGVTVAADNSTDYTKTLQAGTVLTASVAPADATGVAYQWYADGTAISGATAQKFTVTTEQIGKEISVKATDDSKNTVESAKSAKVSDVTLTGVTLQKETTNADQTKTYTDVVEGDPGYSVGTVLKINGTLTGAKKISDVAAVKWIRTIKSANGTAVDTTVAENTDTYTVTKADLEAVQNGATVTIKAEVTPNTNVKAYGTTSGKFTTKAAKINGNFVVSIQANGKDVKNVKAGTKLTAVVTPSDVKVTYQWYKDGKQIAGATSAEYTPTTDGNYRVHAEVAKDETAYNKAAHDDAYVKVGGKTIEKVVLTSDNKDDNTVATPKSTLTADALWTNTGLDGKATVDYTWYRNGVKLTDKDVAKDITLNTASLNLSKLTTPVTTSDSFYCVVTGTGDFLSDPVTSNTVKVTSLGKIDVSKVNATYSIKDSTLKVTGLSNQFTAQPVLVTGVGTPATKETPVDDILTDHITNGTATDVLKDFNAANLDNLYIKLVGANGYTGTEYVKVKVDLSSIVATAKYVKQVSGTAGSNAVYEYTIDNADLARLAKNHKADLSFKLIGDVATNADVTNVDGDVVTITTKAGKAKTLDKVVVSATNGSENVTGSATFTVTVA